LNTKRVNPFVATTRKRVTTTTTSGTGQEEWIVNHQKGKLAREQEKDQIEKPRLKEEEMKTHNRVRIEMNTKYIPTKSQTQHKPHSDDAKHLHCSANNMTTTTLRHPSCRHTKHVIMYTSRPVGQLGIGTRGMRHTAWHQPPCHSSLAPLSPSRPPSPSPLHCSLQCRADQLSLQLMTATL